MKGLLDIDANQIYIISKGLMASEKTLLKGFFSY